MPGLLLHAQATVACTHQATATIPPSQTKVLVNNQPVATVASQTTVAGCPFQVPIGTGTKPQPCVRVQWSMPATKVFVGGQAALLAPALGTGAGVCQSAEQIPQGPPTISQMQTRVSGT